MIRSSLLRDIQVVKLHSLVSPGISFSHEAPKEGQAEMQMSMLDKHAMAKEHFYSKRKKKESPKEETSLQCSLQNNSRRPSQWAETESLLKVLHSQHYERGNVIQLLGQRHQKGVRFLSRFSYNLLPESLWVDPEWSQKILMWDWHYWHRDCAWETRGEVIFSKPVSSKYFQHLDE